MATYYAWSEIRSTKDGKAVTAKVGEKVTAAQLGMSDEEFKAVVEVGSVRTVEYPKTRSDQSPTEYYKEQLAAAARGEVPETETSTEG